MIAALPSYGEVRSQLSRHRAVRCLPVPDPLSIPDELRLTLRGRQLAEGDVNHGERFLLHEALGGRLLVFCADSELALIHQSEFLICDGTFEMSPDTSYQLYTIHGFVRGESLPLLSALLPNKKTDTYREMFQALRTALTSRYGSHGAVHTFLTDFELAAINSIQEIFPETRVKGCSFHFRQALIRRIQLEGLTAAYESATEYPTTRAWLRQLMAMTMLPSFAVSIVWTALRSPPATNSPALDAKCNAFASYFEATWITGDFPPTLWTHFDNDGPRTTNVAEGYHNSLNTSFGVPHPSLRTFLDWLQRRQFEVQCRGLQLAAGRSPKPRRAEYVRLDEKIMSAKIQYNLNIGHVFASPAFPHPDMWVLFHVHSSNVLSYVAHLIGLN